MKRKAISLLLALTMMVVATVPSGCGKQDGDSQDDSKQGAESVTLDDVEESETLLTGKTAVVLGSTLTLGNQDGISYADYLEKKNGMTVVTVAKEGSAFTGTGENDYPALLKGIDSNQEMDFLLVELPCTDADKKCKIGKAAEGASLDAYDTATMTGMMQYIVQYSWETWNAPTVFITGIKEGDKDEIFDIRQAVWPVKYGMDHTFVLDLWEKLDYESEDVATYQNDDGTLTTTGYLEWYGPALQERLISSYQEIASATTNALPQYDPANVEPLADSPLKGKKIIFLGSSVTFGSNSDEASFVEYLAARDGIAYVKEAVSGTTLVDNGEDSYVARMKANIPDQPADLLICQLSTNDASTQQPLGSVGDSKNIEDFDTSTVAGAMEYIIAYAREHYGCPVMFYTGTKYDSEQYAKMVDLTLELQKKWDIGVIDMWNNLDTDIEKYPYYMANGIHPNRAGYLDWWTPYFEQEIAAYLK